MVPMATIVPSDLAPSETVHYSFAGVEFDLGGSGKGSKKQFESTDPDVLSNAGQHPWLTVKADEKLAAVPTFREHGVRPEDDALGAQGPNAHMAFDPAEIEKIESAKAEALDFVLAVDAGLDQDTDISIDADGQTEVGQTLEAADAADNDDAGDKD